MTTVTIPITLTIDGVAVPSSMTLDPSLLPAGPIGKTGLTGATGLTGPTGQSRFVFTPPTSSPGITGQVWSNAGVLTVSLGPGT